VWFLGVERQLPDRVFTNWTSPALLAGLKQMAG
jgi:hypothetical protein